MEKIKDFDTFIFENYDLVSEKIDFKNAIERLKKSFNKKEIAKNIVVSLLSIMTYSQVTNYINKQDIPPVEKKVLIDELKTTQISNNTKSLDKIETKKSIRKNHKELSLSQNGWDHIRNEEGFEEVAYKLGDGKITIGYGHAEDIKDSKYRVGDRISKSEANKLFIKDINFAADGVKRILKEWEKQGIHIKLTQKQYDVLVSLSFNMGIGGLRTSEFIKKVKQNKLDDAAKIITITGINNKYPGLETRREKEKEMFMS